MASSSNKKKGNVYAAMPDENIAKARALVRRIASRQRSVSEGYLRDGLDLIEARKLIPEGGFRRWYTKELSFSKSTAENLVRCAERFGHWLERVTVTHIPAQRVAVLLSRESTPDEVRNEFVRRIEQGGVATCKEINEAIKALQADDTEESRVSGSDTVTPEETAEHQAAKRALALLERRLASDFDEFKRLVREADRDFLTALNDHSIATDQEVIDAEYTDVVDGGEKSRQEAKDGRLPALSHSGASRSLVPVRQAPTSAGAERVSASVTAITITPYPVTINTKQRNGGSVRTAYQASVSSIALATSGVCC